MLLKSYNLKYFCWTNKHNTFLKDRLLKQPSKLDQNRPVPGPVHGFYVKTAHLVAEKGLPLLDAAEKFVDSAASYVR